MDDRHPPDHAARSIARRSVALALDGVRREYPNKIAHVLNGPEDVRSPRALTPAFFGCFDWHSAVHAHWTVARCCRCFPDEPFVPTARARLDEALSMDTVAREVEYLRAPGRASFERPYGLAWLLQLATELHETKDVAAAWRAALAPLETLVATRLLDWLDRLDRPIRTGEHSQTAFAMGLALDWARSGDHRDATRLLARRARDFHGDDEGWRLAFEPSGHDFLSPSLAAADLMRRVLEPPAFATWLGRCLPELGAPETREILAPLTVADPTDGKLAHLDGLNLSRAWMLEGIIEGLPDDDHRRADLRRIAQVHRETGLAALGGDRYETTHWLGSFAVYLVTQRGRPAIHDRTPTAQRHRGEQV